LINYNSLLDELKSSPRNWLVTGSAGFIGSNLTEFLLKHNQNVVGFDNFVTGYANNLDQISKSVSAKQWSNFKFIEGDIKDLSSCKRACVNVDYLLHQAALGSVPRSIEDPIKTNEANIVGFLNMLVAARDAHVSSFTYAASSSSYGDHQSLPKVENIIGKPLSPYAVTKYVNELYADVFQREFGLKTTGLRYFNVFGKRQDPSGAYSAVIPRWISAMCNQKEVTIFGDGQTSRDFCFIDNVIQANILAATSLSPKTHQVYNIAFGQRTSLNNLFKIIQQILDKYHVTYNKDPIYKEYRAGDVRHSLADISKARDLLHYNPVFSLQDGIEYTVDWYVKFLKDK